MFYVGKFNESEFAVPHGYAQHSKGYERVSLMDHALGSVHMGVGIGQLQPEGNVNSCRHAFEKGIYLLEGELEIKRGEHEVLRLSADDYALIPYGTSHALRNTGTKDARWFEMLAPQPKPPGGWQDTFFSGDNHWPAQVTPCANAGADAKYAGRFKEENPRVVTGRGVNGLNVYRFMDQGFGATLFFMMRGKLDVGGERSYHDHTVEEVYFALSGESYMDIEGERFHLRRGDVAWTGVGASHAFYQIGNEPFRWIETQAPQFPEKNGTRYYNDWEK